MFSKAELELIARLCQQHDVLCISDEVYQWLVFDGHQHISIGEPSWLGGPHPPGYLCQGTEPSLGVGSRPDGEDLRVWRHTGHVTWGSDLHLARTGAPTPGLSRG